MNISDEAVEAAARASYEARSGKPWDLANNHAQAVERSWARQVLYAAAPYLMAAAWERGREDCYHHRPNPYRSAGAGE